MTGDTVKTILLVSDVPKEISGEVLCMACRHSWHQRAPLGTHRLLCPRCSSLRGRWKLPVGNFAGEKHWECFVCASDLFCITLTHIICTCCGESWGLMDVLRAPTQGESQ